MGKSTFDQYISALEINSIARKRNVTGNKGMSTSSVIVQLIRLISL